ncbi:MAG: pyridoxamine 5'-phosphate oxidase family protein, partial [Acidimicrobiia bacterium]
MGRVMDHLDEQTQTWIGRQHMFFVASAPSDGGRVNVSPKGLDSFRVIDPTTVAYLDLTGSGAETIAHIRENGRITVMFCAYDGPPRILRLYGEG